MSLTGSDIVVVGAGYAGLSCARSAAREGARVTLLESKQRIGLRPHTTGILVKEAQTLLEAPANCVRKIEGVRLYSPKLLKIDLYSPDYYFLAADTPALLQWMAEQARDVGVKIKLSSKFEAAKQSGQRIELINHNLSCRYLVGADGPRSKVARQFGLGVNQHFLIGAELEMAGVKGMDPNVLHVFLDASLAPGYIAWALHGVGVTQIGLAATSPQKLDMKALLNKLSKCFDLGAASIIGRRGGMIPAGGKLESCSKPGALLLGDAAGTVSPLTAGGIHTAVALGQMAGEKLGRWVVAGGPDPGGEIVNGYPRYYWKRQLRRISDHFNSNALFDVLFSAPGFSRLAQIIFFHNRGLFSAAAWAELIGLESKQ